MRALKTIDRLVRSALRSARVVAQRAACERPGVMLTDAHFTVMSAVRLPTGSRLRLVKVILAAHRVCTPAGQDSGIENAARRCLNRVPATDTRG